MKELRETLVALKIIKRGSITKKIDLLDIVTIECNELISIFVKSIETAKRIIQKATKRSLLLRYSLFPVRCSIFLITI